MTLKRFFLIVVTLILVAGIGGFYFLEISPATPGKRGGSGTEVVVPPGVGPSALADILSTCGVIEHPWLFSLWLRTHGGLSRIRAGRFAISAGASWEEILAILSNNRSLGDLGIAVTVPEGFTLERIGKALEVAQVVSQAEFLRTATDRSFLAQLGLSKGSAEGYLFPDTYYFNPQKGAPGVITKMVRRFEKVTGDLGLVPGSEELHAAVILASIVQAEAKYEDEMPIIAGVYTNRLHDPGFPSRLLQADPAVAYGCGRHVRPLAPSCDDFNGTLTKGQLQDAANPYNTYLHPGLPLGPIGCPGRAALVAALHPQKVPYFYFVAQKTGGRHAFSTTLREHNEAVARYRSGMDEDAAR